MRHVRSLRSLSFFSLLSLGAFLLFVSPLHTLASTSSLSREEGFLMIWKSILRPLDATKEKPYDDVPLSDSSAAVITYAKSRGILDDDARFFPNAPLLFDDAMLWIFRTRNVEPADPDWPVSANAIVTQDDLPLLYRKYNITSPPNSSSLSADDLLELMRRVDMSLSTALHEVSLYSEKFHNKGTAFGELFNMNAFTAAHRSLPQNTLVKVTNVANDRSVIVRINDRGPFVSGRDMDLSLAAFTSLADRSLGTIQATFLRMGDASMLHQCHDDRFQRRITKDVILTPGIPHHLALGSSLRLQANHFFVVLALSYPDGNTVSMENWIGPDESFDFTPSILGTYRFLLRDKGGRQRLMTTDVIECAQE